MGANRFDADTPLGQALKEARDGLMIGVVMGAELESKGVNDDVMAAARNVFAGMGDALGKVAVNDIQKGPSQDSGIQIG